MVETDLDLVVVTTHSNEWPIEAEVVPAEGVLRRIIGAAAGVSADASVAERALADLIRIEADGSNLTNLTSDPSVFYGKGVWSPGGSRIAFHTEKDLNPEIYTMAPNGSDLKRLTFDIAVDVFPSWSPDGTSGGWVGGC